MLVSKCSQPNFLHSDQVYQNMLSESGVLKEMFVLAGRGTMVKDPSSRPTNR